MQLRVAVNATPLLAPRTGIGNYIAELGAALALRADLDLYSFYGFRWRHEAPVAPLSRAQAHRARSIRSLIKPLVPFKRELRALQQQLAFRRGLRRHGIDVYHEPNYVPVRYDIPVVVTVHDLSWIHFPRAHPRDRVRWLDKGLPLALERAAAILVDSEFVCNEILTMFGVARDRLRVAPLGVSSAFAPRDAVATSRTLDALDLRHGGYVLSVGTIEPRKNLPHVLRAYASLPPPLRRRFPLVVAGAPGWHAMDIERELHSLRAGGAVRFVGHVEDDDLVHLYAGAAVFVFASLYEGFGFPPLEAMACGAPVLVSNRASMPEVVGDAAVLLDPDDVQQTASKLEALLEDEALRREYARRGIVRASAFTWPACAERTAAALREAAGTRAETPSPPL